MSKATAAVLALIATVLVTYAAVRTTEAVDKATLAGTGSATSGSAMPQRTLPGFLIWAYRQKGWYANYAAMFRRPPACSLRADLEDVRSARLGVFYVHPGTLQCFMPAPVDDKGIPYHGSGPEKSYPPTHVAFSALLYWSAAELGEEKYRALFLEQAQWLRHRMREGKVEWVTDLPSRGLKAPWISALTQAQTISVLLRAYQHTGDDAYLHDATAAMTWLGTPLSKGGAAHFGENGVWLEEYPSTSKPSHVLNGHLTAALGVWDYYRVTRDPQARAIFDSAVSVVRAEVGRYDLGYWLVYDQTNRVDMINGMYMSWIIEHFKVLHAITGDVFFRQYADKWRYYQENDTLFVKMAMEEYAKAKLGIK
jgi:hypothetical protein